MKTKVKKRNKNIIFYTFLVFLLVGLVYKFITPSVIKQPKQLLKNQFPKFYSKIRESILQLDKEIPGIGEELGLDLFQLVLSRKDINHFDFFDKYEKGECSPECFSENNTWRRALLEYKGEDYKIKIRAHGRAPVGHKVGNFISYAIKLPKGKQINKATRFSLIISERLPPFRYLLIPELAHYFNLLLQRDELVRVKINNGDEKLYYFEPEFDDDYMELVNKSSLHSFCYSQTPERSTDKSMIYTGIDNTKSEFDPAKFYSQFSEIFKGLSLPSSHREAIYNRHLNFNLAIVEKKYDEIDQYFDLDYITSFEAARTLCGDQGHGFVAENFYVFYDFANGKFYPAFHRDNIPSFLKLGNNMTVEQQINSRQPEIHTNYELRRLPLFHLFAQNDLIRQEKYKKIYNFIKKDGEMFTKKQQKIVEFYEKMKLFGWLKWTLRHLGVEIANPYEDYIGNNIKILKSYLEESNPQIDMSTSGSQLILELIPNSMAAICFDNLVIKPSQNLLQDAQEVNFKLITFISDRVVETEEKECPVSYISGDVNLIDLVRDLKFSTWIGEESQQVPRKYILIFSFNANSQLDISIKDLTIGFTNTITEEKISTKHITIRQFKLEDPYIKSLIEIKVGKKEESYIEWEESNKHLNFTRTDADELILHSGTYSIEADLIIPKDLKLIIEPATTLLLGEGKVLVCYRGIEIKGTEEKPVVISSIDPNKPFGSVGILGDGDSSSDIRYLHLFNGKERWADGVYFSGGLSIHYNKKVHISDSIISNNHADDGLNLKYCDNVKIENGLFENNFADQIDLDYCIGIVASSHFSDKKLSDKDSLDKNGDGLDISGSKILVINNRFSNLLDKGLSIGEESEAFIHNNTFQNNKLAVAVKDLSKAYFIDNSFELNSEDINAYQKKDIFGGGSVYTMPFKQNEYKIKYSFDKNSRIYFFPDKTELEKPGEDIDSIITFFYNLNKIKFVSS